MFENFRKLLEKLDGGERFSSDASVMAFMNKMRAERGLYTVANYGDMELVLDYTDGEDGNIDYPDGAFCLGILIGDDWDAEADGFYFVDDLSKETAAKIQRFWDESKKYATA